MNEINISMRPEMSEEERIEELEDEVDELTIENSELENQVSEQTERAENAEAYLGAIKLVLETWEREGKNA